MEVPVSYIKYQPNDYLLAANKLADKYGLSCLAVKKLASWIRLESGSGVFCNNPGNIRSGIGDDFYYHPGAVDEYINGKHIIASSKKDPLRIFKAYKTLTDGIEGMLLWLVKHHSVALDALKNDEKSAYDFAYALGGPDNRGLHYYTANRNKYSNSVENVFQTQFKEL